MIGFERTVIHWIVEDVGVNTMEIAVKEIQSRILIAQLHHLISQCLVVCGGDFVEVTQTTMVIICSAA